MDASAHSVTCHSAAGRLPSDTAAAKRKMRCTSGPAPTAVLSTSLHSGGGGYGGHICASIRAETQQWGQGGCWRKEARCQQAELPGALTPHSSHRAWACAWLMSGPARLQPPPLPERLGRVAPGRVQHALLRVVEQA